MMTFLVHYSADDDYTETSTVGDLGPSNNRICLNISVIDDLDVEVEERFIVTLTTTDPDVDVTIASANVVIEDNDREQLWLHVRFVRDKLESGGRVTLLFVQV